MVGATNRKIKHDALCDSSSTRFAKKLVSLQCSWMKRLYDNICIKVDSI